MVSWEGIEKNSWVVGIEGMNELMSTLAERCWMVQTVQRLTRKDRKVVIRTLASPLGVDDFCLLPGEVDVHSRNKYTHRESLDILAGPKGKLVA